MDSYSHRPNKENINTPVFEIGSHLDTGNEHRVFHSPDEKWVYKIRGFLGRIWQDMSGDAAMRDLAIFDKYDFPIIPTKFYPDALLSFPNSSYIPTDYLMKQPFAEYNLINYTALEKDLGLQEKIRMMMSVRHQIFVDEGLGVDLLGGRAYVDLLKTKGQALGRWFSKFSDSSSKKPVDPKINNLFNITRDVEIDGKVVCKRGDMRLGDTRLFRLPGQAKGLVKRVLAQTIIGPTHHVMTGAMVSIMQRMGVSVEKDIIRNSGSGYNFGFTVGNQMVDGLMRARDS